MKNRLISPTTVAEGKIPVQSTKKFIYALYYDDFACPECLEEGPDEVVFYIGRTKNPNQRLKQHQQEAKTGHEDKYMYIRELIQNNIEWDLKILGEIDASDERPWEFWYVIDFIRKGIALKNMRYGDFKQVPTNKLKKLASDSYITNVDDLKKVLQPKVSKSAKYKSSSSVQQRAILLNLRWLRVESEVQGGEVRKWNIYDLGEGTEEIKAEYSMKKTEVAALLTPNSEKVILDIARKDGLYMKKLHNQRSDHDRA